MGRMTVPMAVLLAFLVTPRSSKSVCLSKHEQTPAQATRSSCECCSPPEASEATETPAGTGNDSCNWSCCQPRIVPTVALRRLSPSSVSPGTIAQALQPDASCPGSAPRCHSAIPPPRSILQQVCILLC